MTRAAGIALFTLAAGAALTAAMLRDERPERATVRTNEIPELIAAMRGVNETACELAGLALGNGWWGGMHAGVFAQENEARVHAVLESVLEHEIADADVPALRTAISDPDPCVARTAARVLGRAHTPAAVRALRDALRAGGSALLPAIIGLAHSDDRTVTADLRPMLGNEAARVRRAAAWALGSLEDPAAAPDLIRLLQSDPDPGVRRTAAWALGSMD